MRFYGRWIFPRRDPAAGADWNGNGVAWMGPALTMRQWHISPIECFLLPSMRECPEMSRADSPQTGLRLKIKGEKKWGESGLRSFGFGWIRFLIFIWYVQIFLLDNYSHRSVVVAGPLGPGYISHQQPAVEHLSAQLTSSKWRYSRLYDSADSCSIVWIHFILDSFHLGCQKVLAVNCCVVLVLLMQLWGPVAAGPLPQSSVDYLIIPYEEASPDTSNDGYRNNQPSVSCHLFSSTSFLSFFQRIRPRLSCLIELIYCRCWPASITAGLLITMNISTCRWVPTTRWERPDRTWREVPSNRCGMSISERRPVWIAVHMSPDFSSLFSDTPCFAPLPVSLTKFQQVRRF